MSDAIDDNPDDAHIRPPGTSDATVEALGKLSEAFEIAEDARGHLYAFHRLTGQSDLTLGEAARMLEAAGHGELADQITNELSGRNVLAGRWTFQIVEEYDDDYFAMFRALERKARDELVGGRRHLFEAEMKEARRTHGHSDHSARPDDGATLTDTTAT
ncbi:hypothetical protein [Leifsonia sp. Leaf264]|uniref:hypothetical protein n=1 Tax=Leifsonia sp. Leaf264 TaxID=1736314 RepID=UPI000A3ED770|nr:hypothetical protein [Leifsonia sp. Leaf264]